jgi:hypothetical protein
MCASNFLKALLTTAALLSAPMAFGCYSFRDGFGLEHAELVRAAHVVALVRAVGSETDNGRQTFTLRTLETLKGRAASTYKVTSSSEHVEVSENDFDLHRSAAFWSENNGRSQHYCCICGPDHRFRLGATYLFFPDKLGAMKSAELIRDPLDRWLAYVLAKTASEAGAASTPRR